MTLRETEKLTNFCNKLIIKPNHETRGYYIYFEYKDKQYYASLCMVKNIGAEVGIFAACDDYVTSWDYLYCRHPNDVSVKTLREHIYLFLESLININNKQRKQNK